MEVNSDGNYAYTTMCPPGRVRYFFTIDKIATFARDHKKEFHKIPKLIHGIEQYDEIKSYAITKFNCRIVTQSEVLDEFYIPTQGKFISSISSFYINIIL